MTNECWAGYHKLCLGYYRLMHPCGCACHTPSEPTDGQVEALVAACPTAKSSESLGPITPSPSIFSTEIGRDSGNPGRGA